MTAVIDRIPFTAPKWLTSRSGALVTVALLQIGLLGTIVADRVRLVKTGREIILPIVPVDPRDLFKGDFVRLSYPISRTTDLPIVGVAPDQRGAAYVTIEPTAENSWKAVRITRDYPSNLAPEQIALKARTNGSWINRGQFLTYGLERYYVPEGTGLALEKMAVNKKLAAIVAVDNRGNAAIKGLSIDGVKVYDEPMF